MQHGHNTNAVNAAGYYTDPAPATAEPFTGALARKFEQLRSILLDANADLVALSDRVLGSIPRGVDAASNTSGKPSGQAEDCLAMLEGLISLATGAREEAQRLNGRI